MQCCRVVRKYISIKQRLGALLAKQRLESLQIAGWRRESVFRFVRALEKVWWNCCRSRKIVRQCCASSISSANSNSNSIPYSITQQPLPSPFSNVRRAALVAASKTSSTPSQVRDEHSRYFRAPISWAISVASRVPTKCCDFFRISSIATGSSRKSFFRPTRIIGTPGHRSFASSTHCDYC